jgi:hypothetical protein
MKKEILFERNCKEKQIIKLSDVQQKILDQQSNCHNSKYYSPEETIEELKQKFDLKLFSLPS